MNLFPLIRLVVFDMAGTTVFDDDAVNECLRAALAAHGHPTTRDAVNEVMGIAKPLAIAHIARENTGVEPAPAHVQAIYQDFEARMIRHYATDPRVVAMPGAAEVFTRLRAMGVQVALDTGFARPIVNAILERLGWQVGREIDASVTSDEVPRGRPHPDLIREAMRRTGIEDPRSVAKVGDTPSDIAQGQASECSVVIGITHGSHTREQLAACSPTHLAADLAEVLAIIEEQNRKAVCS